MNDTTGATSAAPGGGPKPGFRDRPPHERARIAMAASAAVVVLGSGVLASALLGYEPIRKGIPAVLELSPSPAPGERVTPKADPTGKPDKGGGAPAAPVSPVAAPSTSAKPTTPAPSTSKAKPSTTKPPATKPPATTPPVTKPPATQPPATPPATPPPDTPPPTTPSGGDTGGSGGSDGGTGGTTGGTDAGGGSGGLLGQLLGG